MNTDTAIPHHSTELSDERVISRRELQHRLQRSSETMRRWLRSGTLPTPDVQITHRTVGWRVSTLRAAGIHVT